MNANVCMITNLSLLIYLLQARERVLNAENQNLQQDNDTLREELRQLRLTRTRSEALVMLDKKYLVTVLILKAATVCGISCFL